MRDIPIYFITVMEKLEPHKNFYCATGSTRCWGFYFDRQQALQTIHNNVTDLWETCYNYAVLEEYYEGVAPLCESRQFFKYNREQDKYIEIEEPECTQHICNFAIG